MSHEIVTVEWEGRPVEAFVPCPLAKIGELGSAALVSAARAEGALAATALGRNRRLEVAARLLLRTEGMASSRIEAINAPPELVAVAEVDSSVPGPAAEVTDNLRALDAALAHTGPLTREDLWRWHKILMSSADIDENLKGRWRDRLGWIGGPTPHRAAYVATPEDRIEALIEDLLNYANDPPHSHVTAAALLHAQFETIHPFADGNGRIGRLLIGWTLRTHGAVTVPPPVSVAFLRDVGGYLSGLTLYRTAGPDHWLGWFANTLEQAAISTTSTLSTINELTASWPERLAGIRSDAAARRLVDHVVMHPALDVEMAIGLLKVSRPTARAALETLADRGVLRRADRPASGQLGRPANWWVAGELLDLLAR